MFIYGLSMQGLEPKIPKEVADWIKERMVKYPLEVDFELNHSSIDTYTPENREQYQNLVRQYERFYNLRGPGVMAVTFPYLNESWYVKIMVGVDKEGKILDPNDPNYMEKYDGKRTNELRNEIAGLPSEDKIEKLQEGTVGEKRKEGDAALELPREYEEFFPDLEKTSEVTMSGEQYAELAKDPVVKKEFNRAISENDWETLRKLKNRKIH